MRSSHSGNYHIHNSIASREKETERGEKKKETTERRVAAFLYPTFRVVRLRPEYIDQSRFRCLNARAKKPLV